MNHLIRSIHCLVASFSLIAACVLVGQNAQAASGETIGNGDGRIHVISSLSVPSLKNGDKLTIQAMVKAIDGVALIEARIEPESAPKVGYAAYIESLVGQIAARTWPADSVPLAKLELRPAAINQGGVNAEGTVGLWQAEWTGVDLSEGYYRVVLTVTDRKGHQLVDHSQRFSDPIAGNNAIGTASSPHGEMARVGCYITEYAMNLRCSVIDAANGYAYFGTNANPASVVKVALGSGTNPPTRVGSVMLDVGEQNLVSAVIDEKAGYAYFGTLTTPGRVVKLALGEGDTPPTRVGAVTLSTDENELISAVIDTTSGYAYFGTNCSPLDSYNTRGCVIKVALGSGNNPPTRVGSTLLYSGESILAPAVIDAAAGYAYFGTHSGQVVKVALGEGPKLPTRVSSVTLNPGESNLDCAVIDPNAGFAYFVASTGYAGGVVVKVALGNNDDPPVRVGAVKLAYGEDFLTSAVIDVAAGYAYIGSYSSPYSRYSSSCNVIKVALGSGANPPTRVGAVWLPEEEEDLRTAVIDVVSGHAYFGTETAPGRVVKMALGSGDNPPTRIAAVALDAEAYFPPYPVIDAPAGYMYHGTYTSPGRVMKVALGKGDNPPVRTSFITLNPGEDHLRGAVIDTSAGYAYFGTHTVPGRVIKVALGSGNNPPTRIGSVILDAGENELVCGTIDTAAGYAYFGTDTAPGRVIKVALGSGNNPPTRVGAVILEPNENELRCAVIDVAAGYAYFGASFDCIVKVALGQGSDPPTRVGAVTFHSYEYLSWGRFYAAAIDAAAGYAYFGTMTTPGRLLKVALGSGSNPPTVVGAITLGERQSNLVSAAIDTAAGYLYFGLQLPPGKVLKFALGSGSNLPTLVGSLTLNTDENYPSSVAIDAAAGYAYFGTQTTPMRIVKVRLGQPRRATLIRFKMPEAGVLEQVSFYSHAASGNVRLGLYREDSANLRSLLWESASTRNQVADGFINIPIMAGMPNQLTLPAGTYHLAWQTDTSANIPSYMAGTQGESSFVSQEYGPYPAQLKTDDLETSWTTTAERWTGYLTYRIPNSAADIRWLSFE